MAIGSADTRAATTGTGIGPDDGYAINGTNVATPKVITTSATILLTITPTPSTSSSPSSAPSRSLPLGPIIGGLVAALALVALSIFLFLKYRSPQRKIHPRPRAEIDPPTLMPFGFNTRERLGGYVSVNDGSSETIGLSSRPMTPTATLHSSQITSPAPNAIAIYARLNTFSNLRGKPDARTTHALQPPTRNERIHLATTDPSPDLNQGQSQPNLSNVLRVTNNTTGEERASHATTYISETRYQTTFTSSISTVSGRNSDFAPPAYDSLSSRLSQTTSPQTKS